MSRTPRIALLIVTMLAALLPVGLGGSAYAADCGTLHPADVTYGAPVLSAQLDQSNPSVCFDLDLPQGTAILLGERTGSARVRVHSGSDEIGCTTFAPCRLTGSGSQRITADRDGSSEATVDLRVIALTPSAGCPEVTESDLGAPDQAFTFDLDGNDVTCRSVHRDAGQHLLHQPAGHDLATTLVAPDGTLTCGDRGRSTSTCATTDTGTFVLALADTSGAPFATTQTVESVDLDHVASCPAISDSWESHPSTVSAADEPDVACRSMTTARSGDRFVVATGSVGHRDTGQWLVPGASCDHTSALGCTLEGDGPFRVVTWGAGGYQVVARRVGPGSDCPTAPLLAFGTQPTDDHPGVGCRVVQVPAEHPFLATSVDRATGAFAGPSQLYDSSYADVCPATPEPDAAPSPCSVDQPGDVTVISDLFGADTHGFFYDEASSEGCTTPPSERRTHGTELVPFEISCELLDQPAGSVVTTYLRAGQRIGTTSDYVDASGAPACTSIGNHDGSCRLTGTAPFRLLLSSSTPHLDSTTLSAAELDSCPKPLDESTSPATVVTLSAANAFRCLRVASVRPGTTALVHAYRPGGTGPVSIALLDQDGVQTARSSTDHGTLDLTLGRPEGPTTVAVVGTPGVVRIARAAVTAQGQIVSWVRPHVLGTVRVGRTVTAGYGQWSSADGSIHPSNATWLLGGTVVSHQAAYTLPGSAAGKRLVLRVKAYEPIYGSSRTVDSAASTVAPR